MGAGAVHFGFVGVGDCVLPAVFGGGGLLLLVDGVVKYHQWHQLLQIILINLLISDQRTHLLIKHLIIPTQTIQTPHQTRSLRRLFLLILIDLRPYRLILFILLLIAHKSILLFCFEHHRKAVFEIEVVLFVSELVALVEFVQGVVVGLDA